VSRDDRIPILYLAPWVDIGGSDKATIDWFRWLDRDRFAAALITTQPSPNRLLAEVRPYATEVWALPDLMPGDRFPRFIFEFIASRGIELVHIMNSRLGFDLLADLTSMHRRPATVVQLHVEEEDRSGYVRYVTTRYDNLVDAYSVTSHQLATAMADYQVPAVKRRVIHTGVDADGEYNCELIAAVALDEDRFHIVYPARLVDQKDPQLMLTVAAAVAAKHPHVRFHVLGDGPLQPALRARADELGLEDHVWFQGPKTDPRPWYAAAQALLMTSTFEGIPCTIFEAMAMRLPVVAPALPGVCELMAGSGSEPIDPRGDAGAYVRALSALIGDEGRRRAIAERGRRHVRERFGVDRMAAAHAELYEELLAARAARIAASASARPAPVAGDDGDGDGEDADALDDQSRDEPLAMALADRLVLLSRPSCGQPLVSIVVPCFNHGLFLPACLEAIRRQDYPALEVVVVDDGSTDPDTRAVIDAVQDEGWAHVIRLPVNGGPSAARNAALDVVGGRYVLPVDADNLLMPDAVTRLVAQLQGAGATIGFIYPNSQYFGNRNDYFEAPEYNLYALLRGNYCDTCSLFDRTVFDAGVRFAEDITLGHEDWDLMLQLASRGVSGEPARGKTQLYRKLGFTRSDSVEYARACFQKQIARRHPGIWRDAAIKPRECPGLSVVVLDELEHEGTPSALAARLHRQSLVDLELIASFGERWAHPREPRFIRRVPPGEADGAPAMLALGLQLARSPRVLVLTHGLTVLLSDPALLEKIARMAASFAHLDAIAFIDAGNGANPLAPAAVPDEYAAEPHAALLLRDHADAWTAGVEVAPRAEISSLLAPLLAARDRVHWCHLPSTPRSTEPGHEAQWAHYARRAPARAAAKAVHRLQRDEPPHLPGRRISSPRRWQDKSAWMTPETIPLIRHVEPAGGWRMVSNSFHSPAGYVVECALGALQGPSPPGTARLECAGGSYRAVGRTAPRDSDCAVDVLGHVELAPLPLLTALLVATHRATGQQILLGGEEDPLRGDCDVHGGLGFIEGLPIHPRQPPFASNSDYGLHGLLRTIDRTRRRHVYATGATPPGCELVGELGALLRAPMDESVALWLLPDGRVLTERYRPAYPPPAVGQIARWAAAPASWSGFGRPVGRARAVARRLRDAPGMLGVGDDAADAGATLVGYLFTREAPGRQPLWSGVHPVTGDQLLSRHQFEANDMGYRDITLLGFTRDRAPVTDTLELRRAAIPWAARFGLEVRPA